MKEPIKIVQQAVAMFLQLSILSLLPAVFVYIDFKVINSGISEVSLTEISQEILLLATALIFFHGARKKPDARGFLLLSGGFFSCMFIRELDAFLDMVWHGFWLWPALFTALSSIMVARFVFAGTTLQPLAGFINSRSYPLILVGLVSLLVLSRTFGSGKLLWHHLLSETHGHDLKASIQEGLELYSYALIFYGSLVFWRTGFSVTTR
jgi:hypothetical protein